MFRSLSKISLLMVFVMTFSSCATLQQTVHDNPKATKGALGGAILGGVIGGVAGGGKYAAIGAVAGALLGGVVGKKLDERDKRMAREAAQQAFESGQAGQASTWSNPDSGNSGSVTPTRTYQLASGQYCREYQQDIVVGGEKHKAYGTACRQPDGTWRIES